MSVKTEGIVMKNLLCVIAVVAATNVVNADEYRLHPAPAVYGPTLAIQSQLPPAPKGAVHVAKPAAVELFQCVEYDDLDNIHPCAVPRIVQMPDPCACCDPCSCCKPKCVNVRICVPPCGCPKVRVTRKGNKVKYDYGKYEVELTVKKGYIEVDYDD
ncbi:MAG: hypothetical protein CMJ48_04805 [Planctomycetaceae bacterium]|nr:hypothetical protein [Planctomycetaceae bacterium]